VNLGRMRDGWELDLKLSAAVTAEIDDVTDGVF
jgi:hypothetical protein